MTTATLKREDDVKDERVTVARTFLGHYMPFTGVRYYAIFDERDLAEGRSKIGPVGWRKGATKPGTRPEIIWAA